MPGTGIGGDEQYPRRRAGTRAMPHVPRRHDIRARPGQAQDGLRAVDPQHEILVPGEQTDHLVAVRMALPMRPGFGKGAPGRRHMAGETVELTRGSGVTAFVAASRRRGPSPGFLQPLMSQPRKLRPRSRHASRTVNEPAAGSTTMSPGLVTAEISAA